MVILFTFKMKHDKNTEAPDDSKIYINTVLSYKITVHNQSTEEAGIQSATL